MPDAAPAPVPVPAEADPARAALRVLRDEHRALEALLRTMPLLVEQRERAEAPPHFPALRAMLCYLAEYPERLHHPHEERLLFPMLRAARPDLAPVLDALGREHAAGGAKLDHLERTLTAWEWLGDSRREAFRVALDEYLRFYLAHLQLEEREVLPAAREALAPAQWGEIADDLATHRDPLTGHDPAPEFAALYQTLLDVLPAPLGLRAGTR